MSRADDLSEPRSASQADELLAAWTALWHPSLVAAPGAMPRWAAAASPPDDPAGHLILLPPTAEPLLPEDWLSHAEHLGARLIRGQSRRPEMIAAALAMLDTPPPAVDADLAADFLALGFAHFVIETITVSIRYMNSLDESAFERELLAAAVAACGGDCDEARARLQAAYDLLHTAREYYYPSESHLLDLTLVAATTLGGPLRAQLTGSGSAGDALPCNLLLSAQVLQQMAAREPATLDALRHALQQGTASIVGGEFCELELPLLGPEAIRGQLEKGLSIYGQHLGVRPSVFGRRRFGMTPILPQILDHLQFTGVVHATLDDGRFPVGNTSRQRWEGIDGTTVEAMLPRAGRWFAGRRFPPLAARPVRRRRHGQSAHGDLRPLARQTRAPGTKTSIGHVAIRRCWARSSRCPIISSAPACRGIKRRRRPTNIVRRT